MDDDRMQIPADLFFAVCDYFFSPPIDFNAAEDLRGEICDGLRAALNGFGQTRG